MNLRHDIFIVQVVNTPMLPTKFLNLKHLNIWLSITDDSRPYDYLSLVSFLDASPSLETLVLTVRLSSYKAMWSVWVHLI